MFENIFSLGDYPRAQIAFYSVTLSVALRLAGRMKRFSSLALLAFAAAAPFAVAADAPAEAAAATPAAAAKPSKSPERAAKVLKDLKLTDGAKEEKVRTILVTHFDALQAWHETHDAEINPLWTKWAAARSAEKKDEAAAAKVGEQIDAVYADFKPEHDVFLTNLGKELTPAQIEAVKNSLTRSPGLERTYNAYLEMVPQFTDKDKAFIREKLTIAREQAMDTTADKEIVNLFKRQKVLCEAYIDAQGYDYRKSYEAFAAKGKAKEAAAKSEKK